MSNGLKFRSTALSIVLLFILSSVLIIDTNVNAYGDPSITVHLSHQEVFIEDPRLEEEYLIEGFVNCSVPREDPRNIIVDLAIEHEGGLRLSAKVVPSSLTFINGTGNSSFTIEITPHEDLLAGNYSISLRCSYHYNIYGPSGDVGDYPITIEAGEYFGYYFEIFDWPSSVESSARKWEFYFITHNTGNSIQRFDILFKELDTFNLYIEPMSSSYPVEALSSERSDFLISYVERRSGHESLYVRLGVGEEEVEVQRIELEVDLTYGEDPGKIQKEANIQIEIDKASFVKWRTGESIGYEKAVSGRTSGCGNLYVGFCTMKAFEDEMYYYDLKKDPLEEDWGSHDWDDWFTGMNITQRSYFLDTSDQGDWSTFEYYLRIEYFGTEDQIDEMKYICYEKDSEAMLIVRAYPDDKDQTHYSEYAEKYKIQEAGSTEPEGDPFERIEIVSVDDEEGGFNFLYLIPIGIIAVAVLAIIVFFLIRRRKDLDEDK